MEERMRSFLAEYGLIVLLAGAGIVFLVFGIFQLSSPTKSVVLSTDENTQSQKPHAVYIDIGGAVAHPGVYSVSSDSRIADVIKQAGGLTDDADTDYIQRVLNKAQLVKDGQKVFIPSIEEGVAGFTTSQVQPPHSTLININTASNAELESLPGVGTVTAGKIVENRPYATLEELKEKKAVSNSTYEKIKESITIY